jgi:site-specific DNA-methyltransferase (adenine-specific)
MKDLLRLAFDAACSGYSPDRVLADPELNAVFLRQCRELGLSGSPRELNRALLNLRKQGAMRGLRSRKSSFPNQDEYRFAADIAARYLERRDGSSLDDIICDPEKAREFDVTASRIAPGFSSLEYRWAALNLRKASRLKPELLGRVVRATVVLNLPVLGLDLSRVPAQSGLYILYSSERTLYIGEAINLNSRIRKHLDHSDNKGLARWLWEQSDAQVHLELHVLPNGTSTRIRRALERELINSRHPLFNVQR